MLAFFLALSTLAVAQDAALVDELASQATFGVTFEAGRLRADERLRPVLRALERTPLSSLARLLSHAAPNVRVAAAYVLLSHHAPQAALVAPLLRDEDEIQRKAFDSVTTETVADAVASALAQRSHRKDAADVLATAVARGDGTPSAMSQAWAALATHAPKRATALARLALGSSTPPAGAAGAVSVLASHATPADDALIRRHAASTDLTLRMAVFKSALDYGTPDAALMALCLDDADPLIRAMCAIRAVRRPAPLRYLSLLEARLARIGRPLFGAAETATAARFHPAEQRTLAQLASRGVTLALSADDPILTRSAARAIGAYGGRASRDLYEPLLAHASLDARAGALAAVAEAHDKTLIPKALALLARDPRWEVRAAAATTLAALRHTAARPVIEAQLAAAPLERQGEIEAALSALGGPQRRPVNASPSSSKAKVKDSP